MIEKLRKLEYISVKEQNDLTNISLIFIDEPVQHGNHNVDVFTKTIEPTNLLDGENDVIDTIEKTFIKMIKDNCEIGSEITNHNTLNRTLFPFTMKPLEFSDEKEENTIYSKHLDGEIIEGFKSDFDEPGLVLITNETEASTKIIMVDIGFFPYKKYKRTAI